MSAENKETKPAEKALTQPPKDRAIKSSEPVTRNASNTRDVLGNSPLVTRPTSHRE